MQKTILITGSTDGIGFEAAKTLVEQGHHVLIHGRSPDKLKRVEEELSGFQGDGRVEGYVADLSVMREVESLAATIKVNYQQLDVLINNAGVLNALEPTTRDGLEIRFAVNTIAPYLLTQRLLPLLGAEGRVINISSAAQSPVDTTLLAGGTHQLPDMSIYAQSKLALNMWSRHMALENESGPMIVAVNPGSLLATKMVKQAFNMDGHDIQIGVKILVRAALTDEFATASGDYFDNDSGRFASPHSDALDANKNREVVSVIEAILGRID